MFVEAVPFHLAFIAGLTSFFSPCVLPLIPAYFTFITGFSLEEMTTAPGSELRIKVVLSTLSYVCGFSTVFILLGASASLVGNLIAEYKEILIKIGAVMIILFGIHLAGIIRFKGLDFEKRIQIRKKPLRLFGIFIVGMAFGAGWSPCIGPLLGSILILASSQETIWQGVGLLAVYSGGLALPFLLISFFITFLLAFIRKTVRFTKYIHAAAGIFLIVIGLLLLTDRFYQFTPGI
ncbi:MAG: cytochrome c biogenesis CcdA family protein [Thermodesulfobacteriota bacterium]